MSEKLACNLTMDGIRELADLVSEKNLGKIEIKMDDCHVIIEGSRTVQPVIQSAVPAAAVQAVPAVSTEKSTPAPSAAESVSGNAVKAPIVGTFYASPAPDKAPFVKEGQSVKKGDVLFIIESMKLMNEIQSEFDGTVKKILVTNGEAVEYDQPILIIG